MSPDERALPGTGATGNPRGRKRGIALLLVAVLVVGGTVAASELTPRAPLVGPPAEVLAGPASGTAYCPLVAATDEVAQLEIASASATEDSEITITRYVEGAAVVDEPRVLEAGRSAVLDIPPDQRANPIEIDWRGGPVVAQYRLVDDTEQAVATCQTQPSDRWYLSGFDTTRGSRSLVYLFNPFSQDALIRLSFGTAEGPVDLVIAEDILVPAGRVEVRDLGDFRPETADLAVTVSAEVGRVVPQGQVVRGPAGEGLEGVTGRAMLPAVAQPSPEVYLPDALVDPVTQSWVTVYNPGDRAAAVQLEVTTPLGTASALAGELTVPAGSTARIDLAELSALPRLGVHLSSVNGIGLVATRTSAVQDGDRVGIAVAVGVPQTDVAWVVPGARGPDGLITLYNPGTSVATAQVEVAGGQPDEWASVAVPPNGTTSLPLEGLEPQGAALVRSDEGLVAGVVSLSPDTATAFWSATGVPAAQLVGGGEAVPARRDPSLSHLPALATTATPTPAPLDPVPQGEGQIDPAAPPTAAPTPSTTPQAATEQPSAGASPPPDALPSEAPPSEAPSPDGQPSDAPAGDAAAPTPSPGPATTEEGLFGKPVADRQRRRSLPGRVRPHRT